MSLRMNIHVLKFCNRAWGLRIPPLHLQGALPLPPLPSDALRLHSDPSVQLNQERSANQRCVSFLLSPVEYLNTLHMLRSM